MCEKQNDNNFTTTPYLGSNAQNNNMSKTTTMTGKKQNNKGMRLHHNPILGIYLIRCLYDNM